MQRGHHRPLAWLAWGGRKLSLCPDYPLSHPIGDEDHHIGWVHPLIFRLVWVTNSTPVFPQQFGEERQMKNPSNTTLNQRAYKHGSFCVEEYSSSGNQCSRLADLLQILHSSMLWKVATSARENRFGVDSCWLNKWYGNTWGSGPLVYHPELVLSYWRVNNKTRWILNWLNCLLNVYPSSKEWGVI